MKIQSSECLIFIAFLILVILLLDFGITTGTQLQEYPCAFVYNSNVTKKGIFHSPNYPGFYPRDTECHYFFYGNENENIRVHFNYFDVEGVLP